jgi:hypothetical protein
MLFSLNARLGATLLIAGAWACSSGGEDVDSRSRPVVGEFRHHPAVGLRSFPGDADAAPPPNNCGSCHVLPLPPPHPADNRCSMCHPTVEEGVDSNLRTR